ncbi:MAG: dihydroorotate dehydrogenase (quinone) [Legionellales bacterium]|nr:dihydroorotate dehydrogenase (quinone) [Legionellales bacterium]
MLYRCTRPFLFMLSPECAHDVTLKGLSVLSKCHLLPKNTPDSSQSARVMGLDFPSRVGLAAGLDKNAQYIEGLGRLGFGFIEVGTVTPLPQEGNPKPRLFRLTHEKAVINRMGFNNQGLERMIPRLINRRWPGILGVNIGKNKITPNDKAVNDYLTGLRAVYPYADYVTVNISSPNTPDLRALQDEKALFELLTALKSAQAQLQSEQGRRVPMVVKVAPDLGKRDIQVISKVLLDCEIEGLIATNTTVERPLKTALAKPITGGLSGAPLFESSTDVLKQFSDHLQGKVAIIASGGIDSNDAAQAKRAAGADLVQLYTGLIYNGPALIKSITF